MQSLTTSRLRLRRWRDEDLDYFARLSADPAVMAYLTPLPDRAASDARACRCMEHFARHDFGPWAVELPGTCPFIGFVGLTHIDYQAHFTPAVEIAWRLDPSYWGQGYATEAAGLALDDGFERLGLSHVVAVTVPANTRSRAVMQRLGMHRAPADDFDHPRVPDGHELKRHVLYRLRRQDCRSGRQACPNRATTRAARLTEQSETSRFPRSRLLRHSPAARTSRSATHPIP